MVYISLFGICLKCGKELTQEEAYYYGDSCDDCERAWCDSIEEWRAGGENEYFDKLYGG